MPQDPYRSLAQQLDALPNGFPATESGVELKLLAKIFTPEEALLASEMCLTLEPAEVIAERAGMDPKWTHSTLKSMVRKGQIRVGRRDRKLAFGLMPFAVGIYEEQLPRMDEELRCSLKSTIARHKAHLPAMLQPFTVCSPLERRSRLISRSIPTSRPQS